MSHAHPSPPSETSAAAPRSPRSPRTTSTSRSGGRPAGRSAGSPIGEGRVVASSDDPKFDPLVATEHLCYLVDRPDLLRRHGADVVFFDVEEDELVVIGPGYAHEMERAGYERVGTVGAAREALRKAGMQVPGGPSDVPSESNVAEEAGREEA